MEDTSSQLSSLPSRNQALDDGAVITLLTELRERVEIHRAEANMPATCSQIKDKATVRGTTVY